MGVFTLGGGNGNGKSDINSNVLEWVGYPFVTATATASYLIPLHVAIAVTTDTPPMWTVTTANKVAVAVAAPQCERA